MDEPTEKRGPGRPTVRTPENREHILTILKATGSKKAAYSAVRISDTAFFDWFNEDEEFALDVNKAIQAGLTIRVARIAQAAEPRKVKKTRTEYGPAPKDAEGKTVAGAKPVVTARTVEEYEEEGDWRAAAWLAERLDPDTFGRRDTIKLIPPEKMTDADLLAELAAVAQRAGLAGGGEEARSNALSQDATA